MLAQVLRLRRARVEADVDEGRGKERAQGLPLPLSPVEGFQCSRTCSGDAEVGTFVPNIFQGYHP